MKPLNKQVYENISETLYTKKLSNGLTVFLLPKKAMSKTYGLFTTNYGSIDRTFTPIGEQNMITVPDGIAHFLEHKLFEKKDRDVFTDFLKQGASPNAYTSFTKTAYLFSTTKQVEDNVETLLDFVQDPYFSKESVEKEKGIITQEIKMYNDQVDWRAYMGTIKNMFQHHPVNIDIAGTVESIQEITEVDLYTCYHTFYHPENMVLFIAGNFEVEKLMQCIEENQNKKTFPKVEAVKRAFQPELTHVASKESKINLPVSIPRASIGIKEANDVLPTEEFIKKDLLQSMVLDHFFAPGRSFYQTLYDEKLIDASFEFSTTLDRNFGFSLISSNTKEPDQFARKVKQLLLSTQKEQITEEMFATMKKKKIGQLLRGMNSLEYIANHFVHYHLLETDFFNLIPMIQKLSLQEVNSFVQEWINEDKLTVCIVAA